MKELGEYVQENNHLEYLILTNNKFTDEGIEILTDYLIGNNKLREISLLSNKRVTNASTTYFIEISMSTCITNINLLKTSISSERRQEILHTLKIPIDQRDISIKSKTKSAARIQLVSLSI